MKRSPNTREAMLLVALVSGSVSACGLHSLLPRLDPYILFTSCLVLAFLLWRRRATFANFALRFGVSCFVVAEVAYVVQSAIRRH